MKMLKRTLALMLALIMMFSAVPFNAYATESTDLPSIPTEAPVDAPEAPSEDEVVPEDEEVPEVVEEEPIATYVTRASTGEFQRILHLDNGRKYFSVDWIKALITEMKAAGFTHLQLAFGNDGMRFLLDDMSVGSYSDDDVTAAVQAGNEAYYDAGDKNELTQAEMDEIIAHANAKGIEIIPLFNNPGHMDTMISAMTTLGMSPSYNGSNGTIDLEDTTAVAFMKALLQKYVTYFAGKGCTVFNMGADEYANDIYSSGAMGFGELVSNGDYQLFVDYVNALNAMVKAAGMKTMVFNDGIYFQNQTSYKFDTDLMIAFWSSGWGTSNAIGRYGAYKSASASTMASMGHPMVNTNGDYYFVLKNDGTIQNPSSTALDFDNTVFMGSTVSDPAGSMFCIWCDKPGLATEQEVAAAVRITLRKMAASMNNTDSYSDAVVSGGFNADGTLNVVVTPDPEPEVPVEPEKPETVTKTDATTKVAVTAPGLETVEVKENAAVVTEEKVSKTYSITLNGGTYTKDATVKIPYDTAFDGCNAFTGFVDGDEFPVTKDGEYFLCEVPHFSDVEIEGRAVAEDSVVAGSGTASSYVLDKDGLDVDAQYLIVYDGNALTNTKDSLAVTVNGDNATPSADASSALWTYSADYYNYYGYYNHRLSNGSNYLYTSVSGNWNNRQYNLDIDTTDNTLTITSNDDGTYTVYRRSSSINAYINYNSGWGASADSQNLSFYKYTPGTQTFKVNAALQESRIAEYTVESDGYTDDSWNAYQAALTAAQAKLTEVKGATYNSESTASTALSNLIAAVNALKSAKDALEKAVQITINYVDENDTTVKTETVNVSDKATSVALSNFNANDKFYVVEKATLAITPATKTEYTVNVTYVEEDLNNVESLVIELWQTNTPVVETVGSDDKTKTVVAKSAYSEKGIDVTTIAPQTTYTSTAEDNSAPLSYWWSRLLPLATNEQTDESGDDETWSGVAFTKVRYWNGSWAVFTANNEWQNIDLDDYQLVAYYMNDMNLADEVKVSSADWGKKGDGTLENNYLGDNHVSIAFQVVYEDGTTAPVDETAESLAAFTYLVDNWGKRGVGTIALNQIGDYQIWKVTAETGTHDTTYGGAYKSVTVDEFDWDNNELTVWEGDPVSQYTIINDAHNPSTDGAYANLTWNEKNESILIRIYIKTVETEDSLKVVYYDEKFGDTLYEYYISVNKGDNFTDDIGEYVVPTTGDPYINLDEKPGAFESNADRIDVTGFGITNAVPKAQAFQTDLTNVPQAVGKYHSELYTYTGSEIKDNGKTLYLYYNINAKTLSPNFVADFGLPIQFSLTDVVGEGQEALVQSVTVNEKTRYGTLEYDALTKTFTYTPTTILQNIDVLTINIKFSTATAVSTTNVGVTPATTVYYGEKFINFGSGWTTEGTPSPAGNQATEVLGNSSYYGYDTAYNKLGASDGTSKKATAIGSSATFEFTGTGIQVFANATESSGYASVTVKNKATGKTVKMAMVDTVVDDTPNIDTTGNQSVNLAGLPIVSLVDLANIPYATYTVTISKVMDTDPIYIDGIRVFDSINAAAEDESNIYYNDHEDRPDFYELRDVVLKAMDIKISESADYETMYQQLYDASVGAKASAIVTTSGSIAYTDTTVTTRQDLLDNGPKNELYLFPGDTLTFNVSSTARIMQLGMKAPNTAVDAEVTIGKTTTKYDIDSSVDMFYKIQDAAQTATNYTVQVKNASDSGILSVTLLKICDDPSFAFAPLTEDNIKAILADAGYTDPDAPVEPETPVEPEVPEETTKPTEPEVEETTKPSKPSKPSKPEKPGKPENTKPTEPEVEETTKPSKPSKPGKPENTKPTEPQKPGKPGNNGNQKPGKEEKTYTLKITFVNLFGKKAGTATITTTNGVVSASEIIRNAPAGRIAVWLIPVTLKANGNTSIVVPVI